MGFPCERMSGRVARHRLSARFAHVLQDCPNWIQNRIQRNGHSVQYWKPQTTPSYMPTSRQAILLLLAEHFPYLGEPAPDMPSPASLRPFADVTTLEGSRCRIEFLDGAAGFLVCSGIKGLVRWSYKLSMRRATVGSCSNGLPRTHNPFCKRSRSSLA